MEQMFPWKKRKRSERTGDRMVTATEMIQMMMKLPGRKSEDGKKVMKTVRERKTGV